MHDKLRELQQPPAHLDELAHAVIGAAIEVHRTLGPGFLESVYQRALQVELGLRGIAYESQARVDLDYKGEPLGTSVIDLVIENGLVLEIKAVDRLLEIHRAQLISYLKAGGFRLGLLINFNAPALSRENDSIRRAIWAP